jgi:hypothetical protein
VFHAVFAHGYRAANVGKHTDEMDEASLSGGDPPHRRDWRDD